MIGTLIELYDERAIENVIGPETFHPARVVYLCPSEIAQDQKKKEDLTKFLSTRQIQAEIRFVECSLYKADMILKQLSRIGEQYPDCVLDITGGTDAALFAAGMFCSKYHVPAFTYSRKRNQFYDIVDASFADEVPCTLAYKAEEFFLMAGGRMKPGRVDNGILTRYMELYDPFFRVYLKHRREWVDAVTYIQRISQPMSDREVSLHAEGDAEQKGEHGRRVYANAELLRDLEEIGFLSELLMEEDRVSFTFADGQVRAWLRDVGSVLELYVYKACRDTGIFNDVISSAIVDWDDRFQQNKVSNEIDVVAAKGVIPLFISCKTCDVKTEALNELAILRDRFGGKGAKAVMVTTEPCNASARHRAAQLDIAVIDQEELENGSLVERLRVIMKANASG